MNKIVKSYFNSFNKLEKKDKQLGIKNKVFISNLTVKHTSSKVIVTIYIYADKNKELDWQYKNLNKNSNFSLADLLAKYYNKEVVIRVIRLRYLQQNSQNLAQFLAVSLAKRGSNPLRTLRIALQKIRIPKINSFDNRNNSEASLIENFIKLKNVSSLNVDNLKKMESIHKLLLNEVLVSTMHKAIVGLRIQISGRLNRRAIAARAVSKTGQVGTLKNIDSSIKGLSRGLLRGHLRPNVEHASFNGKTRNGAFNVRV